MPNSDSPLHIAVKNNNIDVAIIILQNQCEVHAVNAEGLTPLQLATQAGNTEMIALLLQHGAGRQASPAPPSQPHPATGNTSAPPPYANWPTSSSAGPPITPRTSVNPLWIIGGCVGVVLVLILLLLPLMGMGGKLTTEKFAQNFSATINDEIKNDPNNEVFKMIESAHVSVTCRGGSVSKCVVETLDGGNFIEHDGSNVSCVRFCITVYWDGVVHKGGRTVVEFILDAPSDTITSAKIVETDAAVNIHDPTWWYKAGFWLGTAAAAL